MAMVGGAVFLAAISVLNFNTGWEWRSRADGDWRPVDLPHDFMTESPWSRSAPSAQGFRPIGEAFYRKTFAYDPAWDGRRVILDFGGIMFYGDVKVNGALAAETEYGYLGFETDITDALRKDRANVVEVWAKVGRGSRWYTGGGLYRSVSLKVANSRRIARHGVHIATTGDRAAIEVEVAGCKGLADDLEVVAEISSGGSSVAATRAAVAKGDKRSVFPVALPAIELTGARRWSPETPNLYELRVELRDGREVLDEAKLRFGFRDLAFSSERGFEIDGRKVFLKGQANHHDLGALGAAAYPDAIRRYFRTLKKFGFNSVRCSHNPYSEDFYSIADEEGVLVVDEVVDKWRGCWSGRKPYLEMWPQILTEWMKRDRNHPSVVMWSLGNELQMSEDGHDPTFEDWGVTTYRMMDVVAKRWDATRPTTVAMFPARAGGITRKDPRFDIGVFKIAPELARATAVASFNYEWNSYGDYLKHDPGLIVYQSEASTSGWLAPYFGMDRAKSVGCCWWGATEYWGESVKWPKKGWDWSFFSHTLKPYPQAWLVKSGLDRASPVVHVGVVESSEGREWNDVGSGQQVLRENWNRKSGSKALVWVFSNSPEVELFLNGKSLGRKRVPMPPTGDDAWRSPAGSHAHAVSYEVEWEPGELKAIGSNGAEHSICTTGPASGIRLEPEEFWGELHYVWITAVDGQGRHVPDATVDVSVSVDGPGRMLALDDGDHSTDIPFAVAQRKMKEGYLLAIVRRTGDGAIVLSANGTNIELDAERGARPTAIW